MYQIDILAYRGYNHGVAQNKAKSGSLAGATSLFDRVQRCIDEKIKPFIQMDGGDIELIELTSEKVLKVRLHGACHGCAMSSLTLQAGVQNALNEEFPDDDIQLELVENAAPITNPKY